ncbi:MAG: plastocyanin/azurin family copper-binding protein [Actinomycetota bacterium]|nr:plastocyanin/azurin family copper-binding protein [Actinomycetota bacterium]
MDKKLMAAALMLALASCGGSAGAPAEGKAVVVEHVAFSPARLEVDAGSKVTWTNRDDNVVHTATSGTPGDKGVPGLDNGTPARPDGTFDGEMDGADASFSFTFDEPGTYAYFCRVHQSMTGEIVVR